MKITPVASMSQKYNTCALLWEKNGQQLNIDMISFL